MTYIIVFDFDAHGDPPTVLLTNEDGSAYAEVFEEPTCKVGEWSRNEEDWEAGPIAQHLCAAMNTYTGPIERSF